MHNINTFELENLLTSTALCNDWHQLNSVINIKFEKIEQNYNLMLKLQRPVDDPEDRMIRKDIEGIFSLADLQVANLKKLIGITQKSMDLGLARAYSLKIYTPESNDEAIKLINERRYEINTSRVINKFSPAISDNPQHMHYLISSYHNHKISTPQLAIECMNNILFLYAIQEKWPILLNYYNYIASNKESISDKNNISPTIILGVLSHFPELKFAAIEENNVNLFHQMLPAMEQYSNHMILCSKTIESIIQNDRQEILKILMPYFTSDHYQQVMFDTIKYNQLEILHILSSETDLMYEILNSKDAGILDFSIEYANQKVQKCILQLYREHNIFVPLDYYQQTTGCCIIN